MDKDVINNAEILLYSSDDGKVYVDVYFKDETFWLSQRGMAELFEVSKSSISRHLTNIFAEEELDEQVAVAKIATTTQHGDMLTAHLPRINTIRDDQMKELAEFFGVDYRRDFLNL